MATDERDTKLIEALAWKTLRNLVCTKRLYPDQMTPEEKSLMSAVGLMEWRQNPAVGASDYFWVKGAYRLHNWVRFDLLIKYEIWQGSAA